MEDQELARNSMLYDLFSPILFQKMLTQQCWSILILKSIKHPLSHAEIIADCFETVDIPEEDNDGNFGEMEVEDVRQ